MDDLKSLLHSFSLFHALGGWGRVKTESKPEIKRGGTKALGGRGRVKERERVRDKTRRTKALCSSEPPKKEIERD